MGKKKDCFPFNSLLFLFKNVLFSSTFLVSAQKFAPSTILVSYQGENKQKCQVPNLKMRLKFYRIQLHFLQLKRRLFWAMFDIRALYDPVID